MSSGWQTVALKDVTLDVENCDPSKALAFTYVDISSIDNARCEIAHPRRIPGARAPSRARRPIQDGDVLFSNVRTYLRNVAQVRGLDAPAVASTGFTVLRPSASLDSRFLYHLLRSDLFISQVTPEQTGTHYPATTDRVVRGQSIQLPSLDEQRGLAALIDQIELSRRSAASHVAAAAGALAIFRQTVLAAACSGRLTEDWRSDHPDLAPDALGVGAAKRRRSPEEPLDLDLPDLPEAYALTTVRAVALLIEYGTSKKADRDVSGVPVLRMGNIQDGKVDTEELKYCPPDREIHRLMLQDGDLLFNRTNSPELVGKAAVFHENAPMSFASYLIRVRFAEGVADADFVNYWINSAWGRMWASHVKADGVSQSNINGSKLGAMPLPLPPFAEQQEIVRRVEALLERADRLTTAINAATGRVSRTSQALLTKAFRGEL
jgi:type I restriction enzyme S subunit